MVEATAATTRPAPGSGRNGFVAALLVGALLIALPFAATASGHPAFTTLATRIVILAVAAVSLNLALGYGGMVSFGHAAYYGIGGYAVGIMTHCSASFPAATSCLSTCPLRWPRAGLPRWRWARCHCGPQACSSS
jgi:ABC-type branched-subunit amino acid transport system permease subunit